MRCEILKILVPIAAFALVLAIDDRALAENEGGFIARSYEWDTRPRPQFQPGIDEREERRRALQYRCSTTQKMPKSMRDDCRRAGFLHGVRQ